MLETLFGVANDGSITTSQTIICMIFALILGVIIAITYAFINRKEETSLSFFLTLTVLPAVVAVVIVLVGSNTARALSIAGVFTLVRFRSNSADSRDLSFVFLAMAAGLASGMSYFSIAFIAVLIACAAIIVVTKISKNVLASDARELKVVIPEDMDYANVFDDIFDNYTKNHELVRVKTTNMGTLFELHYHMNFKDGANEKNFLDEIRTRNGNLNITLAKTINKESNL